MTSKKDKIKTSDIVKSSAIAYFTVSALDAAVKESGTCPKRRSGSKNVFQELMILLLVIVAVQIVGGAIGNSSGSEKQAASTTHKVTTNAGSAYGEPTIAELKETVGEIKSVRFRNYDSRLVVRINRMAIDRLDVMYQVRYRQKGGEWVKEVSDRNSIKIEGLDPEAKYEVQARPYAKVGSKKFYGKWSESKMVSGS